MQLFGSWRLIGIAAMLEAVRGVRIGLWALGAYAVGLEHHWMLRVLFDVLRLRLDLRVC